MGSGRLYTDFCLDSSARRGARQWDHWAGLNHWHYRRGTDRGAKAQRRCQEMGWRSCCTSRGSDWMALINATVLESTNVSLLESEFGYCIVTASRVNKAYLAHETCQHDTGRTEMTYNREPRWKHATDTIYSNVFRSSCKLRYLIDRNLHRPDGCSVTGCRGSKYRIPIQRYPLPIRQLLSRPDS